MRFGFRVTLLLAMAMVSAAAVILLVPKTKPDYMAAGLRAKYAALASASSPKIVFIGGSSGAFGIDSERIQAATGVPTVNMALNAPVGLEYMLNEVKPHIRAGDVVVLSPEYHLFYPDLMDGWNPPTKYYPWMVLDAMPSAVANFTPQKLVEALTVSPGPVMRMLGDRFEQAIRLNNWAGAPTYAFNANGDFVGHLGKPTDKVSEYALFDTGYREPDPEIIAAINAFADEMRNAGARVVLMYPPLMDTYFDRNAAGIAQLDRVLRSALRLQIVSSSADFRLPRSDFYDTIYHLNAAGRQARADKMIAVLKGVLP